MKNLTYLAKVLGADCVEKKMTPHHVLSSELSRLIVPVLEFCDALTKLIEYVDADL